MSEEYINNWEGICVRPVDWDEIKASLETAIERQWITGAPNYTPPVLGEHLDPAPTNAEIAEVLETAADLFESGKLEWIQGQETKNMPGIPGLLVIGACAVGAVGQVADQDSPRLLSIRFTKPNLHQAALKALRDHLGGLSVPTWNDTLGRTVDEVIDLFKTVAKNLRNEDGK